MLASIVMLGTACKTFVVENVNYAQQIESVLVPDENGNVHDVRHGITFNVTPFQEQEFGVEDSAKTEIKEVRLIRNAEGYYFITANNFKNVYVMEPGKGNLRLRNKIQVSEERLSAPAFNLRDASVQLVKTDTNEVLTMNENGLQENSNDEEEEES
ncbi:MAG: hypothetical protein HUJ22_04295 [Gracilimonas sp.]|nr:hypothetical protein [Gracilimonas sp.]